MRNKKWVTNKNIIINYILIELEVIFNEKFIIIKLIFYNSLFI